MLDTKKVKEIKQYGKDEVRYFFRSLQETEKRGEQAQKEFKARYPEGVTTYYKELVLSNDKPEKQERLIKQFGYTKETLQQRAEILHEAFWASWKWWTNKKIEIDLIMAKYQPIFKEAEEFAKKVDVSDITDGFPCGMAILYLKPSAKDTDLGKALRAMSDCDSYSAKTCHWSAYKLPIKLPSYGQCMSFDQRVCEEVAKFLTKKGLEVGVHSMID